MIDSVPGFTERFAERDEASPEALIRSVIERTRGGEQKDDRTDREASFWRRNRLNALIRRAVKKPKVEWRPGSSQERGKSAWITGFGRRERPESASKPNGAKEPGIERIREVFSWGVEGAGREL
jgi:hypothetical protein